MNSLPVAIPNGCTQPETKISLNYEFFKKLFGDNKQNQADKKPDIDSLLLKATDKLILELDTYLCELSSYGDALEKLTEPQKTFYFNQYLEKEINNGGFN